MSTLGTEPALPKVQALRVRSVVGLAHDEIRGMVVSGALAPGARLGQGELADQLGISRGSVREALRRLAGDGLVVFHVNRGFFVADVSLEGVLGQLEARLIFEPGVARAAAARRTEEDLVVLRASIEDQRVAESADAAHDTSRAFHRALAAAGHNAAFVQVFDSLWIADVGRRLLARRRASPDWQPADVSDHLAILEAVERRRGREAERLMHGHIARALCFWREARPESGASQRPAGSSAPV